MALTTHASTASMRHDVSTTVPSASPEENADSDFWGEDGFTFGDFLDIINPLQHIPIVSTFYRAATGDEISTGSRVFGSTLLGGAVFGSLVGLFGTVADAIVKETTGKEVGEHAMALFDGPESDPRAAKPVLLASVSSEDENRSDAAPAQPTSAAPDVGTGEDHAKVGAKAGHDTAETPTTPMWLTRLPKAREDYSEMAARAGARTSTDAFLGAISHGLDKFDQTKTALDLYQRRNHETAPVNVGPVNVGIDTIL